MRRRRQITCLVGGTYVYDDGCHNTFCHLRVRKKAAVPFALRTLLRSLCPQALQRIMVVLQCAIIR
jgi:hypothetical protein